MQVSADNDTKLSMQENFAAKTHPGKQRPHYFLCAINTTLGCWNAKIDPKVSLLDRYSHSTLFSGLQTQRNTTSRDLKPLPD